MKPASITAVSSAAANYKPSTLEFVARAIRRAKHEKCCTGAALDDVCALPLGETEMKMARAALQSLRQVDDETRREMALAFRMDRPPTEAMGDAFTAAIDHILTEGGER